MEMQGYTFAPPQGDCVVKSPNCPAETITNIHDETAKALYSSIETLTSLLNRARGPQPSGSSIGEKEDRTILRDAAAIRAGAYRISEMVNQLASIL